MPRKPTLIGWKSSIIIISAVASLLKQWGFTIVDFATPYRYKAQMEIYAIKEETEQRI